MFLIKKLTRLLKCSNVQQVQMMIKQSNQLTGWNQYAYETSKDLVSDKEEIKCNNIIKQYEKRLTLMI